MIHLRRGRQDKRSRAIITIITAAHNKVKLNEGTNSAAKFFIIWNVVEEILSKFGVEWEVIFLGNYTNGAASQFILAQKYKRQKLRRIKNKGKEKWVRFCLLIKN